MDDEAGANWCFVLNFEIIGVNSQSKKKTGLKSQFRYKTKVQTQEPHLINVAMPGGKVFRNKNWEHTK